MHSHRVPWREVVPWVALLVVFSCAGAKAPVTAPAAVDRQRVRSLETDEIILTGKDGKPRGKLTADGLSLSDEAGNTVTVSLGKSAKVELTGAGSAYQVILEALPKSASLGVVGAGNVALLGVDPDSGALTVSAGKRTLHAAVEANRPLADLEVFDSEGRRRASFGLNSNGEPRFSLYDTAETRRIYGILTGDVPVIDLNNRAGEAVVELLGGDPKLGSGLNVYNGTTPVVRVGAGPDGKPLR